MSKVALLDAVIDAHGGRDVWSRLKTVEVDVVSGGGSFP
jgi:hypothetical protein